MSKPVIFIMGVSGSGKTTIARMLSERLGFPWFDGDEFHPAENLTKMESGSALNDEDRKAWLESIHRHALEHDSGAIYACSALKESYRELLSRDMDSVQWVFLKGDYELIKKRMEERSGHFMPPALLQSQFETLEEPAYGLHLGIHEDPQTIIEHICRELNL